MTNKTLSIIIPVYNEEKHIINSFNEIKKYILKTEMPYEIILIDDGSKDKTWNKLEEIALSDVNVKCFGFTRNFGKEAVIRAGLQKSVGDGVIIIDCDLQHPPVLIPEMVNKWINDNFKVINCRKNKRPKESIFNKISAKFFYYFFNKTTGGDFQGSSDFKLMDREVVNKYLELNEYNTFFRGLISWFGFKSDTIYFSVPERVEGQSKWSIMKLLKLSIQALVSFTTLPLQIVSIFGVIFLVVSFILIIQTLFNFFRGTSLNGFTTVIILQLIIGSIIMICLGILGLYIANIYEEIKKRHNFIIDKSIDRTKKQDS